MTREEAKELLPILVAFSEGKKIEMSTVLGWSERENLDINMLIDNPEIFRIKPEPKYRPFANADECWQEMQKHQPFGWVNIYSTYNFIYEVSDTSVCLVNGNCKHLMYDYAVDHISFTDGQPFGIKVNGNE